jgi:hypothetical protein
LLPNKGIVESGGVGGTCRVADKGVVITAGDTYTSPCTQGGIAYLSRQGQSETGKKEIKG